MENKMVVKDEGQTMLEASNNRDVINELKVLYYKLISPVKFIEHLIGLKYEAEVQLDEAKSTLAGGIVAPFVFAIKYTLYLALPFIFLFLIFTFFKHDANGARLINVYSDWFAESTGILDALFKPVVNNLPLIIGTLLSAIGSILIVGGIVPVVMFLFPTLIVVGIVVTIILCIKASFVTSSAPSKIASLDKEINDRVDEISGSLAFVPPNYRTSEALEYICNAVDNYKADSLKEALLQYDTFVHNRTMEQGQQKLINLQIETLGQIHYTNQKLDQMSKQLKDMQNKLSDIRWNTIWN